MYDVRRLMIREGAWSADALSSMRGAVLTSVDILHKNNAQMLGDDLKQEYDAAVAHAGATPQ
jgi:hypothetical protein